MKALPEVEYVCRISDWSSDASCNIVTQLIDSLRRSDISQLDNTFVFCHNDGMATGVYKAVVEQNVEGRIKILGIDGMPGEGLEYVKLGHQVGTYYYPTHGEKIIRLALDILTGKPYERENPLLGFVVTPDNVDLVITEAAELMKQNKLNGALQHTAQSACGQCRMYRRAGSGYYYDFICLVGDEKEYT